MKYNVRPLTATIVALALCCGAAAGDPGGDATGYGGGVAEAVDGALELSAGAEASARPARVQPCGK